MNKVFSIEEIEDVQSSAERGRQQQAAEEASEQPSEEASDQEKVNQEPQSD